MRNRSRRTYWFALAREHDGEQYARLGPFCTKQEAQWRADYEHRCAVELFGNHDERSRIDTQLVREVV